MSSPVIRCSHLHVTRDSTPPPAVALAVRNGVVGEALCIGHYTTRPVEDDPEWLLLDRDELATEVDELWSERSAARALIVHQQQAIKDLRAERLAERAEIIADLNNLIADTAAPVVERP